MTETMTLTTTAGRVRPKVLVVDDDANLQQMLQVALESEGFNVVQAVSGAQFVEVVRNERPDVVLLDQSMEPVSGVQALQALRATGDDIPVMILTELASEEFIETVVDRGADDFLAKPFSSPVLVAHLKAILRRREWQACERTSNPIAGSR